MPLIVSKEVAPDELERLDFYYGATDVTFNGHFYDYTRKIYMLKSRGGDYVLIPCRDTEKEFDVSKAVMGMHHYVADSYYKFINSFITINGSHIETLGIDHVMTLYLERSFAFFKSLPYNIKVNLKEKNRPIFNDYTKLKIAN